LALVFSGLFSGSREPFTPPNCRSPLNFDRSPQITLLAVPRTLFFPVFADLQPRPGSTLGNLAALSVGVYSERSRRALNPFRPSLTPFLATHPRNSPVTPLLATHPKKEILNPLFATHTTHPGVRVLLLTSDGIGTAGPRPPMNEPTPFKGSRVTNHGFAFLARSSTSVLRGGAFVLYPEFYCPLVPSRIHFPFIEEDRLDRF